MKLKCFTLFVIISFTTLCSPLLAAPAKWVDFPRDELSQHAGFSSERFVKLHELAESYHSLEKSSFENLAKRIQALEEIRHFLEEWMREESFAQNVFLKNIHEITINKSWYLNELKTIYSSSGESLEKQKAYHEEVVEVGAYLPLILINSRHYDSKLGVFWGEYWLETLDPCHRRLASYHDIWKREAAKNHSFPPFFLWLETQDVSADIPFIAFYSEKERQKCRTQIRNGHLYCEEPRKEDSLCDEGEKECVYIIDMNKELYITPASQSSRHISLSHGKAVLAAGTLKVKKGKITEISFESGHYLPSIEAGKQTIQILKELNVELHEEVEVKYYQHNSPHVTSLLNFMRIS